MGRIGIGQLALRVLCALALLSVSFAHKTVALPTSSPAELAAYTLPDGSLPVRCLPGQDGSGEDSPAVNSACDACRIAASILLPGRSDFSGKAVYFTVVAFRPMLAEDIHRQAFPPSAAPRAPPAGPSIA